MGSIAIRDASVVCVGSAQGGLPNACSGDSGGPTSCKHDGKWTVVGVASWVRGCHNAPTVYTSTAWYLDWIQEQIQWYEGRMACGTKPEQTPWEPATTAAAEAKRESNTYEADVPVPAVVGGREAQPGSWPWQLSLHFDRNSAGSQPQGSMTPNFTHTCGASLLDPTWALTAAHCVDGGQRNNPNNFRVLAGLHSQEDQGAAQMVKVKHIIKHQAYFDTYPWPNDIALLKLETPVYLFDRGVPVSEACLPDPQDADFTKDECWMTGWGKVNDTDVGIPTILQEAEVAVLTHEQCVMAVPPGADETNIFNSSICVGSADGGIPNACSGDSGGPTSCYHGGKWVVVGVASWVKHCHDAPTVYTRTSYYIDWIEEQMTFYDQRMDCGHKPEQRDWITLESPDSQRQEEDLVVEPAVVGGRDAEPGSWPWQLSLHFDRNSSLDFPEGSPRPNFTHTCGASLLSETWALTAAHCVDGGAGDPNRDNPNNFKIFAGMHMQDERSWVQEVGVEFIIIHEGWIYAYPYSNDVALLKLKEPIAMLNENVKVGFACLPRTKHDNFTEDNCWMTGWGKMNETLSTLPNTLQEAEVDVLTHEQCGAIFPPSAEVTPVTESNICVGSKDGGIPNACSGDSGGPTSCYHEGQWYVVGIASWVRGCHNAPTVYTRTSYFLDWIEQKMAWYEEKMACGNKPNQRVWVPPIAPLTEKGNTDEKSIQDGALSTEPRIVGGRDAEPGTWPWQLSLHFDRNSSLEYPDGSPSPRFTHTCGASLLSETWALTAAHCVHGGAGDPRRDNPNNFRLFAGMHAQDNRDNVQEVEIRDIIIHEGWIYDYPWPNDIALLKLKEPVKSTDEHVISGVVCYPPELEADFTADECWMTGWGLTHVNNTEIPNILQEAKVDVLSHEQCVEAIPPSNNVSQVIFNSSVCVGSANRDLPNACSGDSGGPTSCYHNGKWYVVGVASWVTHCHKSPTVYTRTSYFKDWVEQQIHWYDDRWACGTKPEQVVEETQSDGQAKNNDLRVIGGRDAVPGSWPWMLSLHFDRNSSAEYPEGSLYPHFTHTCGASLLDETWAVTAAHCVTGGSTRTNPINYRVIAGLHEQDLRDNTQTVGVTAILIHPGWVYEFPYFDDIALLKLSEPVHVAARDVEVSLACMPETIRDDFAGEECWLVGWGVTNSTATVIPNVLQEGHVDVLTHEQCIETVDSVENATVINEGSLCVGNKDGVLPNACYGDSGGPINCYQNGKWYLAGLVSWGYDCHKPPHVSTRTSYYANWVMNSIREYDDLTACGHKPAQKHWQGAESSQTKDVVEPAVVGGREAEPGSWPWQLSLHYDYNASQNYPNGSPNPDFRHTCGASLLSATWAVTAAHCVDGRPYNSSRTFAVNYRVVAALHSQSKKAEAQTVAVEAILYQDEWWMNIPSGYDIALLKLKEPVKLQQNARTVCLPDYSYQDFTGDECWTTGWGLLNNTLPGQHVAPDNLHEGRVQVMPQEKCIEDLIPYSGNETLVVENNMCIEGVGGEYAGTCHGDSGGPTSCYHDGKWYIVGTTFWSASCHEYPSVLTRVSEHIDWLKTSMTLYDQRHTCGSKPEQETWNSEVSVAGAEPRVVGGRTAQPGSWPWQISLHYDRNASLEFPWGSEYPQFSHTCGAMLIYDTWVLTAAHCVTNPPGVEGPRANPINYRVYTGMHAQDSRDNVEELKVKTIIAHETWDFSWPSKGHDIALLKLTSPATFIKPDVHATLACLPDSAEDDFTQDECWMTGWGLTNSTATSLPNELQEGRVSILSHAECLSHGIVGNETAIHDGDICVGGPPGGLPNACNGDSGGPASCYHKDRWVVVGVTSWGSDCHKSPTVYTGTAYFRKWIDETIKTYDSK